MLNLPSNLSISLYSLEAVLRDNDSEYMYTTLIHSAYTKHKHKKGGGGGTEGA